MASNHEQKEVNWRAFRSLVIITAANSLNEKGIQFMLIALGIWMVGTMNFEVDLQYPLSVLIVLPFVLFSPLAGWVADRCSKTKLLRVTVLLQGIVILGVAAGLFLHSLWVTLFFFSCFCVQAMFFSPGKKGIIKNLVGTEHIGFASGITEMASLLALLVGQIAALFIVYYLLRSWGPEAGWEAAAWPALCCTGIALWVICLAFRLPMFPAESNRPFEWNLLWRHFGQLRLLGEKRVLLNSEIGIGYFWFIAGTVLLIVLQAAEEGNPAAEGFMNVLGQQQDSALLMMWLSGGSVLGGVIASLICGKRVRLWLVPAGGLGMVLGCTLLATAEYGTVLFFASLFFTGFIASGYLVPLNALLQDCADDDKRGDVIAAGNLVDCFLGMLAVGVQFSLKQLGISPSGQFAFLAGTSLMVAIYQICNLKTLHR